MRVPAHVLHRVRPTQFLDDPKAFPKLFVGHTDRHKDA